MDTTFPTWYCGMCLRFCDKEEKIIDVMRSNAESAMDEILRHLSVTVVIDKVSEHNAAVSKNKVSFALLIIMERSDGRSSNIKSIAEAIF